jgi:hypothetical protein
MRLFLRPFAWRPSREVGSRRASFAPAVWFRPGPGRVADPAPVFATQVESVLIDAFATNDGAGIQAFRARFRRRTTAFPRPSTCPTESLPVRVVLVFDTSSSMRRS